MKSLTETNATSGNSPNPSTGVADNAKVSTADVNEAHMIFLTVLQPDVVERQVRPGCRQQGMVVTLVVISERFS